MSMFKICLVIAFIVQPVHRIAICKKEISHSNSLTNTTLKRTNKIFKNTQSNGNKVYERKVMESVFTYTINKNVSPH